jgi:hypothetical protein
MNDKRKQLIQNVVAGSIAAAAIIVIAVGNVHFKHEVQSATDKVEAASSKTEAPAASAASTAYQTYMKNLPAGVQEKLKKAAEEKKPLHLVITGDEATPAQGGWPKLFEEELKKAYGDLFQVTVKSYPQKTTQQWIDEKLYSEIASLKPDVVLYEPALLLDGGSIEKQQSVVNTQRIAEEIAKSAPGVSILVQPPNPLYQAKYFPETVQMVKDNFQNKGYTYIDHWQAWPKNDDLLKYLDKPNGFANEEGQKVWAKYMTDYFVAK